MSISCVCCVCSFRLRLVSCCPSRVVRLMSISCVCCPSVRFVCVCLLLSVSSVASVVSVRFVCVYLLRLSISCVSSVLCVMSNSSGSIVYLPIHYNTLKSISLKRLSGSTCLTGFGVFRVFEVFGVFEVFKGIRRVQRFHSNNPLSKSHNSFSCPYRL